MFQSSNNEHSELGISTNFDCNEITSTTQSISIGDLLNIGLFIHSNSGTNTTHEITIQISVDDVNWFDTSLSVTGLGYIEGTTVAAYIRAKATVVEGQASTVDLELISK